MKHRNLTGDLAIDAACVEFEKALRGNESPSIEEFVGANPDIDHHRLIEQLVLLEVEFLAESEQLPTIEHYEERFPQHRAAIAAILEGCKSGTAMRTAAHEPAEQAGESIGHYRLLEQIGEGGMGVVFMAEQTKPVRRKVALKIIKPGMDTKQVIGRFEAERQALAMMDHPNIARVLDAGSTESGRPYFVMELVRGIPITDYSDQNKLPTSERLELFVNVCQAVQHAHTKGIIHRDIKPSNVLVTHHDGVPIPKIIDFGVAKATNQQLTERTLFTAFAQMIGTPLYMSPEQAEMSGLDVDTRSDIYSLGVLLYELLTGTTPVNKKRMQTAAFDEIRRMIREEDPAKPSTAVSTLGEEMDTISMRRGTDANKLRQSLSGELDWIVMKALEKDRTRRFQTASDFAEDVQRHLAGETVEACPPTLRYRMSKFTRRYRTQVAVASTFLALLFGSTLVAWGLYAQARTSARDAESATSREEVAKQEAIDARQDAIAQRDRAEASLAEVKQLSSKWLKTHYVYNLSQAAAARGNNSSLEMLRLLENCDPSTRGWEWNWLRNSAREQKPLVLEGNPEVVVFELNRTGSEIAIVDEKYDLRVHRFPTGELLWKTPSNVNKPLLIKWSPDDRHLGVVSQVAIRPGQAVIWNTATHDIVWEQEDGNAMGILDFSPDGQHFVLSRSYGTSFEYWALDSEKPIWIEDCKWFPICFFSPDGKRLFVSETQTLSPQAPSQIYCYDIESRTKVWGEIELAAASTPAVTPDGKRLFTSGPDRTIIEWDAETGQELNRFDSQNADGCYFLGMDPTGQYLFSAYGSDGVIHDLSTRTRVARETSDIFRGAFAPDGQNVIVQFTGMPELQICKTVEQATDLTLVGHEYGMKSGFLSSDETKFFSASLDGTVRKWDLRDGLELEVREVQRAVYASARSADGRYYATGGPDGVKLWDASTNAAVKEWTKEDVGVIYWIDFSQEGHRLTAAGKGGTVWVWESTTQELVGSYQINNVDIDGLSFCSPAGERVAILPRNNATLELWDVSSRGKAKRLRLDRSVNNHARDVKWCLPTNTLAIGNGTNVELWDLTNETRSGTLRGHGDSVSSVAFNSDGSRVFSGSLDGELKVWDSESHQSLLTIQAHQSVLGRANAGHRGIEAIVWSEANKSVITCGGDGLVKVWETVRPDKSNIRRRELVSNARTIVDSLRSAIREKEIDRSIAEQLASKEFAPEVRQFAFQIASVREGRSDPPMKPELAKPPSTLTAESFKLRLSETQQQIVEYVEASSGIPVSEDMVEGQDLVEFELWQGEVRKFVAPKNLSLEAVEATVQPLVAAYPKAHHFHYILGCAYAWRGHWEDAYEHLNKSIDRSHPESELWFRQAYELAPIAVHTGNLERYQELCEQVVEHGFAFDADPSLTRRTTKMLSIARNAVDAAKVPQHIRAQPKPSGGGSLLWHGLSQLLSEYRLNEFDTVIQGAEQVPPISFTVADNVMLPVKQIQAMALYKTGQTEKAKTIFKEAEDYFLGPDYVPTDADYYTSAWHDYLYVRLVYKEAKALLAEE